MTSALHETLHRLFRSRTTLAPELCERVFQAPLPKYSEATIDEADFTQVVPTEYRADLVILLRYDRPVYAIVVEAQLSPKASKRFTWPLYVAALRDRHRCPASVLVVTPSKAVARWARTPIELGFGSTFRPLVLGPDAVPWVQTTDEAHAAPELAVLSALAHGNDSKEVVLAAINSLSTLDDPDGRLYFDVIWSRLRDAIRQELETMALSKKHEYQSDFAKKYFEEGREEGERRVLSTMLTLKFGPLPTDVEDRLASADAEQLERWVAHVLTATSLDEVFTSR